MSIVELLDDVFIAGVGIYFACCGVVGLYGVWRLTKAGLLDEVDEGPGCGACETCDRMFGTGKGRK